MKHPWARKNPGKKCSLGAYICGPTTDRRPHLGNYRTILCSLNHWQQFQRRNRSLKRSYKPTSRAMLAMNYTDLAESVIQQARLGHRPLLVHNNERIREVTSTLRRMGLRPWRLKTLRCTERLRTMRKRLRQIERLFPARIQYTPSGIMYYPPNRPRSQGFHLWRVGLHLKNPYSGEGLAGWHLECAAMIVGQRPCARILHYGGRDLAEIHHVNEDRLLAVLKPTLRTFYAHTDPLLLGGEKMSKSKGNVFYPGLRENLGPLSEYLQKAPIDRSCGFSPQGLQGHAAMVALGRIPRSIWGLWKKRVSARKRGLYDLSDALRLRIQGYSYIVRDEKRQSLCYRKAREKPPLIVTYDQSESCENDTWRREIQASG